MVGLIKSPFSKFILLVVVLLVAVSCGRRGSLEAPLTPTVISVDENGNESQSSQEADENDKPFILDPLL